MPKLRATLTMMFKAKMQMPRPKIPLGLKRTQAKILNARFSDKT